MSESWVGGPVSFHRCFLSEMGKLRNSFLTIGTQRTCDGFVLSIVGAKAATAKYACVKYMWVFSFMSPLLEFGPKVFLNGYRIYVVACSIRVFGGTSIRTTLFRFRSPVFSANRSAASGGVVAHW